MDTPATGSNVSTGSSPAPSTAAPVSAQSVLDGMSESQRTQWELTGDLPDASADSSPASTSAASSVAKPAEQAASTDVSSAAASEPATPGKQPGHKGNAETRVQELLASDRQHRENIARLQGQLEALSRGPARTDGEPGSSPAKPTTQAEHKRYLAMPDAPQEADFESFAEFSAALGLFITDQRWQEHTTRAQQTAIFERHVQGVEQISQTATERIGKATAADPEFTSRVNPDLLTVDIASVRRLNGEKVGPQHVLAEEIARSEHVDKFLVHFSSAEGQLEWARLCALPPSDLFREFGRLEARFESSATSTTSTPTTKTLSTSPAPSPQLGTRPTEPIDPSEAALKRKDYAAYEAAENAKAVGAR